MKHEYLESENSTVQIVLTCPNCGNTTFIRHGEDSDFMFECFCCEDMYYLGDMGTLILPTGN